MYTPNYPSALTLQQYCALRAQTPLLHERRKSLENSPLFCPRPTTGFCHETEQRALYPRPDKTNIVLKASLTPQVLSYS